MKVTIINTGGTFNKRYNPIKGILEVPNDNNALDKIISNCHNIETTIINIISKDSLDINNKDRKILSNTIKNCKDQNIIIIHGTDTIDLTSSFLSKELLSKKVIFTGAMIPMSIDEVEATMNFSLALGFLSGLKEEGIYIAMHGVVVEYSKLIKDAEAITVGYACIIDRSLDKSLIKKNIISQIQLNIPTYRKENLPENLLSMKPVKPGSRNI